MISIGKPSTSFVSEFDEYGNKRMGKGERLLAVSFPGITKAKRIEQHENGEHKAKSEILFIRRVWPLFNSKLGHPSTGENYWVESRLPSTKKGRPNHDPAQTLIRYFSNDGRLHGIRFNYVATCHSGITLISDGKPVQIFALGSPVGVSIHTATSDKRQFNTDIPVEGHIIQVKCTDVGVEWRTSTGKTGLKPYNSISPAT
ncbi:hypothetical protein EBR96_01200 [bacterium]|nr:hypothetical protein [bacterium]